MPKCPICKGTKINPVSEVTCSWCQGQGEVDNPRLTMESYIKKLTQVKTAPKGTFHWVVTFTYTPTASKWDKECLPGHKTTVITHYHKNLTLALLEIAERYTSEFLKNSFAPNFTRQTVNIEPYYD